MESTASLLQQIREGDARAKDRLLGRYLPILQSWASGRLPARARDLVDTGDIVQITLMKALGRIEDFEPRHEGAFLYYLRTALLNQVRDQARRVARQPERQDLETDVLAGGTSPADKAVRTEVFERYERALDNLPEKQRQAVVMRIEMDFTHQQVADAIESPSADAARMLVTRALERLAEEMDEAR